MKIDPRCAYCLLSTVYYEARLSTDKPAVIGEVLIAALDALQKNFETGSGRCTANMATIVHRRALEILDDPDPYMNKKLISRQVVSKLMPHARLLVDDGGLIDRFRRAITASVIGNTLDFGVDGFDVNEAGFDQEFNRLFHHGLTVDDTDKMIPLLGDVVYLADNSGEILLDTLVIKEIKRQGGRVTLVVRGAPILNDATMEDVEIHGLDKLVDTVLTTGSNAIGVCRDEAPRELKDALNRATLIISKGMANYETMSEYDYKPIAYILRTKCQAVADDLGLDVDILIARLAE